MFGEIIKEVLDAVPHEFLEQETGRNMAAQQCEEIIIGAVIHQFAHLLGGNVEFDDDGQAIVYTNHHIASQSADAEEPVDLETILNEAEEAESP